MLSPSFDLLLLVDDHQFLLELILHSLLVSVFSRWTVGVPLDHTKEGVRDLGVLDGHSGDSVVGLVRAVVVDDVLKELVQHAAVETH